MSKSIGDYGEKVRPEYDDPMYPEEVRFVAEFEELSEHKAYLEASVEDVVNLDEMR